MIIFNEDGNIGDGLLLGVDIERYKKMFPNNYSVIEGRDMKPNERGMLFSSVARENIYNFMDFWVVPKGSGVKKENLTKDAIENGADEIDMVINIPKNLTKAELDNDYQIRRTAVDFNIPLVTNARLASAFIDAFTKLSIDDLKIKTWNEYRNK